MTAADCREPDPGTEPSWDEARETALRLGRAARPAPAVVPVADGLGTTLARSVVARSDLPPNDVSAMDGYAVAGPGPWRLVGRTLAGMTSAPLARGEAVEIATGAWLPQGARGVLRREAATRTSAVVTGVVSPGLDVRPRGQEARAGELLLEAGTSVTPAVVALACAAGVDELAVQRWPTVAVLVLGDELLASGLPRAGRVRDALGPALPGMVSALGGEVTDVRRVRDDPGVLAAALRRADSDVVITTGATAAGPVDHLHRVLQSLDARLVVDGVAVRPGHPMLLARSVAGRPLVGLPGNPLAAVSGVLTLLGPLLAGMSGRDVTLATVELRADVTGHPADTRLVPLRDGRPSLHVGPAMLRGLAEAEVMAVIPPRGASAGSEVRALRLPW